MKIYPLVDWCAHTGATPSGPGSPFVPTAMPLANAQTEVLGDNYRVVSDFLGKTYIEFDLGSARSLRGLSAIAVQSGTGATAVDAQYRFLASSSATIVEELAPTAATFTHYSSSPGVGDINDDPDNDDDDWLTYDGSGESHVNCTFGKTASDFDGSGAHTTTYVRFLAGATDSGAHDMVVTLNNDTAASTFALGTFEVDTDYQDGGALFTASFTASDISGWSDSDVISIDFDSAETSGDCAILGAVRLYIPGQGVVANGDTGWLNAFPSVWTGDEPPTSRLFDCHGVFGADVSARYVRFWLDNGDASQMDVGRVLAGAALSPQYSFDHKQGSGRQAEDTSTIERSDSGQPFETPGVVRKISRWNLAFLSEAETHSLETYFDYQKGLGSAFVVVPDEDTQTNYIYQAVYGQADQLQEIAFAGRYNNSGSMDMRYRRELSVRQVAVD